MKSLLHRASSKGPNCFWCFLQVCKKCNAFCYVEKNDPGRMHWSSQLYLFNSNNIEPSTKVTNAFKICVSFAD